MRTNINRLLGQNVKQMREGAGLSQEVLAEHLHLSQEAVSRRESGKPPFSIEELYQVAQLLECELKDLMPGSGGDDWGPDDGPIEAYYRNLPPDTQDVIREMLKAAYEASERKKTTHGRKAE